VSRTFARKLRRDMTEAEQRLWSFLRRRQFGGHRFRRQQMLGRYIVDLFCLKRRLIIEVDGSHHGEQAVPDATRTAWLESQGFRVIRFWNTQVLFETEAVFEEICCALGIDALPS